MAFQFHTMHGPAGPPRKTQREAFADLYDWAETQGASIRISLHKDDRLYAVISALRRGMIIEAIKAYREAFPGTDLRTAKDAVDGLKVREGIL